MRSRTCLTLISSLILCVGGCAWVALDEDEEFSLDGPEALEWLRNNKNESALASNRFRETPNAIRFVEELYAAGAEKVVVPEDSIRDEEEDGPYADALVVTMPADPAKRKQVFDICAKELKREGINPKTVKNDDVIYLWWD